MAEWFDFLADITPSNKKNSCRKRQEFFISFQENPD
jgi:hypothetical protein